MPGPTDRFRISIVRTSEPDVAALLRRHIELMQSQSPAESCHVLPLDALEAPDVTLLALRDGDLLLAVGALKVAAESGELKSMHTAVEARGRGAGKALLKALIHHARSEGLTRIDLETGSGPEHAAARRLYQRAGFTDCPPFGTYRPDPLSHFMSLAL